MIHSNDSRPLVSVVVPAYRADFLEEALQSVMTQTYRPLELVVSDDCRSAAVESVVEAFRAQADFPVHYRHNAQALGEQRNTTAGVAMACGEYIKFLHDDDRLAPGCIEALVRVMEEEEGVVLASSRRRRVDEQGAPVADVLETACLFPEDVLIDGPELVSWLVDCTRNFIGEPSAVLCRRSDLLKLGDNLMSLNGTEISWVGDLALYVQLLRHGYLALLAEPLMDYRVSDAQTSQQALQQRESLARNHAAFRQGIVDLGWYRGREASRDVRVAAISRRFKARVFEPLRLLELLHQAGQRGTFSLQDWLAVRRPSEPELAQIEQRLASLGGGPQLDVLVLDRDGNAEALGQTLDSLDTINLYRRCKAQVLNAAALADAGPAAAMNRALAASTADWLLVIEAGERFTASGLLLAALDLAGAPAQCLAVYGDEVMRLDDGEQGLVLRPDLNLDLLLSFPASVAPHWLYRRGPLLDAGGFDVEAGEACELDYQLRLIESHGLGAIGHISEPLLCDCPLPLRDSDDERRAILRHLSNRGYPGAQLASRYPGRYEIDYGHGERPGVSILIDADAPLGHLQRCLQTLLEKTAYSHYEVLLLVGVSPQPALAQWLAGVEAMGQARLRVLRDEIARSPAQRCNNAALQAHGDFLLFLGATAGVLQGDWLVQLLNHGLRPEVGAVGGKLLAADGSVRQAGLLLGLGGPAGPAFRGAPVDWGGYMSRLLVEQNYSALSRECMLLRRQLFVDADGFDEDPALARWIDADLCLRLQQAGYLHVWTPRAVLLMDEPEAVQEDTSDEDAMYQRWLPRLARDPASSPHASLDSGSGFTPSDPAFVWHPLQGWSGVPTVLAHPADLHGCGHYRVIQPFNALRGEALVQGGLSMGLLDPANLERLQPDSIVLQRQLGAERLERMRRYKAFSNAFKVYELDDYLPGVPLKSMHRKDYDPSVMVRDLRKGLSYVDRFVVSTEPLAEALSQFHGQIQVVRNSLDPAWWGGLQGQRRRSDKPRVGWAGGSSHTGDLEMMVDVVKELAGEVEWVFFGMCPEKLRPYVHEFHAGVPIDRYPEALAKLDLDLALAPVESNLFNECKSNLRLLEYGACGFPVVASDLRCYQGDLPVTLVKNRFRDWVEAIRMHIADLDATARQGDALREAVLRDYMLEGDNLRRWLDAWRPN